MIEMTEHFTGLIRIEVSHHNGLNLRVLVADYIGYGARLHPLQAVQAAGAATQQDAVDQVASFVFAQSLGQHLADVAVGTDTETGLVADGGNELPHHAFNLLALNVAHLRHGHTDALHFLGPQMAQHLRSIGFTKGQQEDRGLVDLVQFRRGFGITHQR